MMVSNMDFGTIDRTATAYINGLAGQNSMLDFLMLSATKAGVPLLLLMLVASWWWGGGSRSERHIVVACGLAFLLGLAFNQGILLFVHRIRPYDAGVTHLLIARSADPSFPSDHATASFAIVFGYLVNARIRKAAFLFAFALLVVLSRIYLGTHYVGDVIGGVVTAAVATIIVGVAYRPGTRIDQWITGLL